MAERPDAVAGAPKDPSAGRRLRKPQDDVEVVRSDDFELALGERLVRGSRYLEDGRLRPEARCFVDELEGIRRRPKRAIVRCLIEREEQASDAVPRRAVSRGRRRDDDESKLHERRLAKLRQLMGKPARNHRSVEHDSDPAPAI